MSLAESERLELKMAGAMDMAAKLPKIRDEERENKVEILEDRRFNQFSSCFSVWICLCCLWTCGHCRTHVWQRDVRAGQVGLGHSRVLNYYPK